jgi:hypothetical protein
MEPPRQAEDWTCPDCGTKQTLFHCGKCHEPDCAECSPAVCAYFDCCRNCLPHEVKQLVEQHEEMVRTLHALGRHSELPSGGRCWKLIDTTLGRLRTAGVEVDRIAERGLHGALAERPR